MKKSLPYIIPIMVSVLFYWISSRSYALQSGPLQDMGLFRLFTGISNIIALCVPLMLFVFYMLTSNLMFTLLDEKYDSGKMARVVSLSFIPVILNCVVYLLVLYGLDAGLTVQELLVQRSFMGLGLADMERVGYVFWVGFYMFFTVLIQYEFGMSYTKAAVITVTPTLLVVAGKYLIGFLSGV